MAAHRPDSTDQGGRGLAKGCRLWGRLAAAQRRIPANVRSLSWVSFTNDLASEMLYPIVPLFLTITLGAPVAVLGLIEGIAEGVAVGLRGVAGRLSDLGAARRRPWIAAGYGASAAARPIVAAAPAWGFVLAGRLVDRAGKAARTAPRDALIRDSTPHQLVGAAFGYHRALDTAGAVVGPLIAVGLLAVGFSLRGVLWLAVLPGAAAALLVFRVREASRRSPAEPVRSGAGRPALPRAFWMVLAIWMVFSLGNSSDVFLILRAENLGAGTTLTVLAYALYNLVYASLSWPLGALSDRVPRPAVVAGGLAVYVLVYIGFALASGPWAIWPLFVVYGVYIAATEGVARAWVADYAPEGAVGTAYGLFAAASGGALLVASVVAGVLWSQVGPAAPFVLGAVAATIALLFLVVFLGSVSASRRPSV
jgi:MFS family permease